VNEINVKNPNYEEIRTNLRDIANDLKYKFSELQEQSGDNATLRQYAHYLYSVSDYFTVLMYNDNDIIK
jgi:hypothetical protein